jgi:PhnB protein
MKRTLMQIYVKESIKAVEFYQKAFDAPLVSDNKNEIGTYYEHAELDVYGQILAVAEDLENREYGGRMQFCLHFGSDKREKVTKAYDVLAESAVNIDYPLGPCSYSPHMASLTDRFGIYWCIFTE